MSDGKKLRVLHVVDVLTESSGVAQVVMGLVAGTQGIKHDVALYGECSHEMENKIIELGGAVYRLPNVSKLFGIFFRNEFRKILQEQKYTTIHGHLTNSAFIYLKEAKKHGIPHRIIQAHNTKSSDYFIRRVRNFILTRGISRWANDFVAVSEAAASKTFGKYFDKASIIGNGIDTARFRYDYDNRVKVRQELCISADEICVGHVGRFARQKNHFFLIDVYEEITKRTSSKLILIGSGPLEDSVRNSVNTKKLNDNVIFLGEKSDVERYYQAFDVFLLPSIYEGFGTVTVEAQCSGLPCLVSDTVPKSVACSDNIRFLPINSITEWANAAISMACTKRVDRSNEVIHAKLDLKTQCEKMQRLYEQGVHE